MDQRLDRSAELSARSLRIFKGDPFRLIRERVFQVGHQIFGILDSDR